MKIHTHTHTMFYSVVNKIEIMKFPSKWMELENIELGNLMQKDKSSLSLVVPISKSSDNSIYTGVTRLVPALRRQSQPDLYMRLHREFQAS